MGNSVTEEQSTVYPKKKFKFKDHALLRWLSFHGNAPYMVVLLGNFSSFIIRMV